MLTNNKRQNHKKQAEVSDSEEDRLSKLPVGIITQILSFLSTRESVRTSILSTRWKYIWSSVPALDLTYSDFKSKAYCRDVNFQKRNIIDNFLNVVDRLLTGHSQHVLDKVHIDGSSSGTHDGSHINAWICAAIKRNVRKLNLLGLDSIKPHELHQSLLSSNALVVLKLDLNVILNFPMTSTCFPNLKVLKLEHLVTFKDDTSAQNLISSCPVLEDLFISRNGSHNLRILNLTSWSLKKLILRYDGTSEDTVQIIVIDIPALETLDIEDGFIFSYKEQGTPLESDVVPNCLTSHLKTIEISGGSLEGICEMVRYFLKNAKVLKELTIKTYYYEDLKKLKIDCEDIFKHRRGSMTWSDGKLAISFV
ncbi:hypothetical protein LguiA_004963 [Lonicera macranthoides]